LVVWVRHVACLSRNAISAFPGCANRNSGTTSDSPRHPGSRRPVRQGKPDLGYDRIQGAVSNLGHTISDASVGTILKAHGLEPAPDRKRPSTGKTFLQAHWEVLAAVDFTTVEVWSKNGLVTFYLLVVMEVATRRST
jgi:hypothetical protein